MRVKRKENLTIKDTNTNLASNSLIVKVALIRTMDNPTLQEY